MSTSSCGSCTFDDVAGRSRLASAPTLDDVRAGQTGPTLARLVLAARRTEAVRGAEAARRGGLRHRHAGDDGGPPENRVRGDAQGTQRAPALARRTTGAAGLRVRGDGEGLLR